MVVSYQQAVERLYESGRAAGEKFLRALPAPDAAAAVPPAPRPSADDRTAGADVRPKG